MTARAIAGPTSPILVLVAEVSADEINISFPSSPQPGRSGWVDEWYGSGKFDRIVAWLGKHCAPDCMCCECGDRMAKRIPEEDEGSLSYLNLMFLTAFGPKAYFLCQWCGENWKTYGLDALPNVMAKAMVDVEYRDYGKRANA